MGVSARLAVPKAVLFKSSLRLINMAYSFVVGFAVNEGVRG